MSISPHLFQAVRESRNAINREYTGLLCELDVAQRIRNSLKQHPIRWLGGAIATGLLTTLFGAKYTRPPSKVPTPAPFVGSSTISKVGWGAALLEIGKLLYPVLQPLLVQLASKLVQTRFAKKSRSL